MADRSEIKCRSCGNSLGAWARGTLVPGAHLLAGRDLWVDPDQSFHMECPRCHAIHVLGAGGLRLADGG